MGNKYKLAGGREIMGEESGSGGKGKSDGGEGDTGEVKGKFWTVGEGKEVRGANVRVRVKEEE